MGLIQRVIEAAGVPTVGLSIVRAMSERVRPPRTVFLKWPYGHPLGRPFEADRQRAVLLELLKALETIDRPGEIIDLGWPWRR